MFRRRNKEEMEARMREMMGEKPKKEKKDKKKKKKEKEEKE